MGHCIYNNYIKGLHFYTKIKRIPAKNVKKKVKKK